MIGPFWQLAAHFVAPQRNGIVLAVFGPIALCSGCASTTPTNLRPASPAAEQVDTSHWSEAKPGNDHPSLRQVEYQEVNAGPGDMLLDDELTLPETSTQLSHPELLPPATASNSSPDDLDGLIAQALAVHPEIRAARQRVASLANRIPQVTALEDPTFNNTFWPIQDQALQTAGGRIAHQFAVGQKVPWPGKLDARGTIARREVQIAQADVAKVEQKIIEQVRLAYYELWLAGKLINIVEDNRDLVADLVTVSEARYMAGGSQQDVLRAELEGDKLDDQLINLRRQREQARADLGTLVRQPVSLMPTATSDLRLTELAPRLEELVARAEACNPTLQGLAAEIARDRAKTSLACLQKYPDFQFGLGYSIVDDDNNVISPVANGHDNINFTVGITLPIWRDKIDAGIREANLQRNSTANRREAERDRLRGELRRQVAAAYAAIEQLSLFRERLVPRTEQTLEITTADYQGEKADFTDLVDMYRELLSYQVQVARAEATLASTLARIERTVGCETLPQ